MFAISMGYAMLQAQVCRTHYSTWDFDNVFERCSPPCCLSLLLLAVPAPPVCLRGCPSPQKSCVLIGECGPLDSPFTSNKCLKEAS